MKEIGWQPAATPDKAIELLQEMFERNCGALKSAFEAYVRDGTFPDDRASWCYPALRIEYLPEGPVPPISAAFGKMASPGIYQSAITRPALYADYLKAQLELITKRYEVALSVGPSGEEIPYPYVLGGQVEIDSEKIPPAELATVFPTPDLAELDDDIADGKHSTAKSLSGKHRGLKPLSLFTALRTDYSLQRLKHYTGTEAADFQDFILFTNYHRYMDAFVEIALGKVAEGKEYESFVAPGGIMATDNKPETIAALQGGEWRRFQMPAYHLKTKDRKGISLINIGVGPSNAKTITDHLAVLRPQCWIMVGHCGGLRHSQRLGDYVLAHAYLRRDQVLDSVLPADIPVPPIAEIQTTLTEAASRVTGDSGADLKRRLRTGTVVTHADRNWELRFEDEGRVLDLARAVGIDMESATVAANGYRFRVPYGTLLCVSDKPLHGEIKLPGAANRFYEKSIGEHIRIGIEALEMFRRDGSAALHSRKLRSFDEPPFR
ncbi:AMP nucleosidase [Parvularcula marina]|uniref:AMP nucleosidase n=1 Tax=Parvularcula marina TaxID=2292771 RepID=UPI003514D08E